MAAAIQEQRTKPASPAVQKAFAIIELFTSQNGSYTLSEVSRMLKYPLSTTSALLQTMQQCGYLTRTGGSFSLTTKLLTEAARAFNQMRIPEIADSELHRLVHSTGLSAVFLIREDDHMVCIGKVDGLSDIRVASYVGRRFHMHFTGTGKAVLAHLPDDEVNRILSSSGLPRNTPRTITSIDVLATDLRRIRAQGYSVDDEEFATHIRGIGAAVFDQSGQPIGGIAITGGADEVASKTAEIITEVRLSARNLSQRLGYAVTEFDKRRSKGALAKDRVFQAKSRSGSQFARG